MEYVSEFIAPFAQHVLRLWFNPARLSPNRRVVLMSKLHFFPLKHQIN